MNIYPDLPWQRGRAIVTDVLVVLLLWLCWTVGMFTHDTVAQLDVLGRGVQKAGHQVEDAFGAAGNAVDGTPVVGDDLERALTSAADKTGRPVVRAGSQGREAIADLAQLLGWIAGGVPAFALLLLFMPRRITAAARILAARRVLAEDGDAERRRLLAMRAAFALPFAQLLRHTRDPLGDLAAGRYEPLLQALGDEYGLRLGAAGPAGSTPSAAAAD